MKRTALSRLARRTEPPAISWLMQLTLSRPQLISLAAGFTDNESLPVAETRALIDEVLKSSKTGRPALQYGSTAGDPRLRELTAGHIRRTDGASEDNPAYSPDRMIITNGSQQMLAHGDRSVVRRGRHRAGGSYPSYFVYLAILQSHGIRGRGVRMTLLLDGLDLEAARNCAGKVLKRSGEIRRVKMLYLVTYFQNPTGVTTSYAKKAAALALLRKYEKAAGHPIYLLEDAAYRELRFKGDDVKSALTARGGSDHVIYAGTYSKPFASGMRVGFGLLPEPVLTAVTRIKGNHDFGTSNLPQQLLARALASGRYDLHLVTLRKRYARKARVMLAAMKQYFPAEVKWWEPAGGLYFWAKLPPALRSGAKSRVFKAAIARDILYVPGELCYVEDPARQKPDHEMRLSFGGGKLEDIQAGIGRLGSVLRKMLKTRRH